MGFIKLNNIEVGVPVSAPNVLLGRLTAGAGEQEEIEPTVLTEETAPAAGDFLPIWTGDGLRKVDFSELGGGGGGGSVATDTIWDAKGDIVAASAADTAARLPVGSDGEILVADSSESLGLKWKDLSAQTTEYTTPQTDTSISVPAGAKGLSVVLVGPGGGGGGGRRGAAGTSRGGGAGGGGGSTIVASWPLSALGSPSSILLTIGQGGRGGNGATANNTNGSPATIGTPSDTYIKVEGNKICQISGNSGTQGGTQGNTTGGGISTLGMFLGTSGGATTASGPSAVPQCGTCAASGGGGGGNVISNTAIPGANGGASFFALNPGASGGSAGNAGSNAATPAAGIFAGSGGGGGGGSTTGNGGNGGNGIRGGGGGGGGGATNDVGNGGNGGNGGDGYALITFTF